MNSLYTIVSILAATALIISTVASLQQQTSAIIVNWREEFRVLTDEFEDAVSNATDQEPPNLDSIQQLVDDYKTNLTKIFENSGNYTGML
jgi:predicted PurR-regulated permease PerM